MRAIKYNETIRNKKKYRLRRWKGNQIKFIFLKAYNLHDKGM